MLFFVTVLHIVLCIVLCLIIILQPGKGGDVASAFGGGGAGSAVFGPRGPANLLSRATTIVAVLFMTTSITLALNSDRQATSTDSIEDQIRDQEKKDQNAAADTPDVEPTPADPETEALPSTREAAPQGEPSDAPASDEVKDQGGATGGPPPTAPTAPAGGQ